MNDFTRRDNEAEHRLSFHDKKAVPAEITLRIIRQFARTYRVQPMDPVTGEFILN